jgi:hypothetical protein
MVSKCLAGLLEGYAMLDDVRSGFDGIPLEIALIHEGYSCLQFVR